MPMRIYGEKAIRACKGTGALTRSQPIVTFLPNGCPVVRCCRQQEQWIQFQRHHDNTQLQLDIIILSFRFETIQRTCELFVLFFVCLCQESIRLNNILLPSLRREHQAYTNKRERGSEARARFWLPICFEVSAKSDRIVCRDKRTSIQNRKCTRLIQQERKKMSE